MAGCTSSRRQKPELPVDRGWAWVVMVGAFLNVLIIMSFNRSVAVFFVHFLEEFEEPSTVITLAFAVDCVVFSITSLLVPTFLLDKFTVRCLTTIGSAITAACIIGMSYSPSISHIIVLFGLLGFGHGLIFVPQTSLIGYYFRRHLTFANAFSNIGLGIATMVSPVITQILLDVFGLQGALLLHGGFALHMIPASLLLRPISEYTCSIEDTTCDDVVSLSQHEPSLFAMEALLPDDPDHDDTANSNIMIQVDGHAIDPGDIESDLDIPVRRLPLKKGPLPPLPHDIGRDVRKGKLLSASENVLHRQAERKMPMKAPSKLSLPAAHHHSATHPKVPAVISSISASRGIRFFSSVDIPYTASLDVPLYGSRMRHKSADLKHLRPSFAQDRADAGHRRTRDVEEDYPSAWERLRDSVCSSVWTYPAGIMLLFGSGFAMHSQAGATYLPVLGQENGLSSVQIPFLLTIAGACDLISKLFIGFLSDMGCMKRIHIVCIINLILGLTFQFTCYFKHLGLMIMMSIIFGMSAGVVHFMLPVMVVDILGVQYIGHIMSGYLVISGVVMSLDHIIVGGLKDYTDSFAGAYNYMGALILLSVLIFSLEPLVSYFSHKNTKSTKTTNQHSSFEEALKTIDK